jgi:ketosteroid isomerase-like protein
VPEPIKGASSASSDAVPAIRSGTTQSPKSGVLPADRNSRQPFQVYPKGCLLFKSLLKQEQERMDNDPISVARKSYQAYVDKDRSTLENVIADDFHFTSPLDNRIDRNAYFERCWPNSETIVGFDFVNLIGDGERVFVTYEGQSTSGKRFRNTEIVTVQNGVIIEVEVYFGWSIPHEAPAGCFVNP